MRALVTGATGFVGTHLIDTLRAAGAAAFACGGPQDGSALPLDLAERASMRAALDLAQPDVVFHLAAQTFVPDALASPEETYAANVMGTANVAAAIREYATAGSHMPRLIFASSAEAYGPQPADAFPLRESARLSPANPYAASKAAAEMLLLGESRAYGLDVVIARSFNLIGAGQSDRFVVSNFAHQLAAIAAGGKPVMYVGNLDARRDFLHVSDAARAYVLLAQRAECGEIYNMCSGIAHAIKDVLREMILAARVPVEIREDPQRMRPSDTPLFVGDNAKLRETTGWKQEVSLRAAVREMYEAACGLGPS